MAEESIEDIVRRIIRSTQGGIRSSHTAVTSPSSCEEELDQRFNIPRRETTLRDTSSNDQQNGGVNANTSSSISTASTLSNQYNANENYGYTNYNRRQRRAFPYSRNLGSSSRRPRSTSRSTRTEAPTLKEVIVLPKPSWNEVPKYKKKAYLQEKGYIIHCRFNANRAVLERKTTERKHNKGDLGNLAIIALNIFLKSKQ